MVTVDDDVEAPSGEGRCLFERHFSIEVAVHELVLFFYIGRRVGG